MDDRLEISGPLNSLSSDLRESGKGYAINSRSIFVTWGPTDGHQHSSDLATWHPHAITIAQAVCTAAQHIHAPDELWNQAGADLHLDTALTSTDTFLANMSLA